MNRRDVEMLDFRMRLLHVCFRKDLKDIEEILDEINGKHMREQGVDYVIEYMKKKLLMIRVNMGAFNTIMDTGMKEALCYLKEICEDDPEPEVEQCPLMSMMKELCEKEEIGSIFSGFGV